MNVTHKALRCRSIHVPQQEISGMKIAINARARIVAAEYMRQFIA